jgi:membrane protein YqaA with SNARE-associated domain
MVPKAFTVCDFRSTICGVTEEAAPAASPAPPPEPTRNPLKRLYRWILSWAHHPLGTWALGVFAFIDSSFFPVPPLFLQVALSLERPKRSWWYAAVDTAASVAGAVLGFYVGYALFATVGQWVIRVNGLQEQYDKVGDLFGGNAFVFILIYSFLPFPYKVITIGSGVYHAKVSLATLLVASTIGRSARFFLLAALCFFMGRRVKDFIDRYFNLVTLGVGLLVVAIIAAMKLVLKR